MSTPPEAIGGPTCPVQMSDGEPCDRPLHRIQHGDDKEHVCLMHTHDPAKDQAPFRKEIDAILAGRSRRCPKGSHDFTGFVFPVGEGFSNKRFEWAAYFNGATFAGEASFVRARFTRDAYFLETDFRGSADFRFLRVDKDVQILFARVTGSDGGLHARFLASFADPFFFDDVNWYQRQGRLILQDELDLDGNKEAATHELVADAYRRLVNNFEKSRQYELAEQCVVGEIEMRRRNPIHFLLASWAEIEKGPRWKFWRPLQFVIGKKLKGWYEKSTIARWLGEHLSFLYAYRALSTYGSSYGRALAWLLALVLVLFPVLYGFTGLRLPDPHTPSAATAPVPSPRPDSFVPTRYVSISVNPELLDISWSGASKRGQQNHALATEFIYVLWKGIVHSAEVVTLQRNPGLEPAGDGARLLAAFEIVAAPGQLALFLFALRRRFRR